MSNELFRGVFDNNVLVSAALLGGAARQSNTNIDVNAVILSFEKIAQSRNRSRWHRSKPAPNLKTVENPPTQPYYQRPPV